MLLVNARVSQSKIHGLGLFADQFILQGTMIWEFNESFDVIVSEKDVAALPLPCVKQLKHYAYFSDQARAYFLSSDDDRFTNHSETPNSRFVNNRSFAIRDIVQGEEITMNYSDFGARGLDFVDDTSDNITTNNPSE